MASKKRMVRLAAALGFAAVLASATYAFTASNTVPASKAGIGSGAISGYSVSSVKYTLNATDPSKIDAVSFTLDTAPTSGSTVKAQLASGGGWFSCTLSGAPAVNASCNTTSGTPATGVAVSAANQLTVVAAD